MNFSNDMMHYAMASKIILSEIDDSFVFCSGLCFGYNGFPSDLFFFMSKFDSWLRQQTYKYQSTERNGVHTHDIKAHITYNRSLKTIPITFTIITFNKQKSMGRLIHYNSMRYTILALQLGGTQ